MDLGSVTIRRTVKSLWNTVMVEAHPAGGKAPHSHLRSGEENVREDLRVKTNDREGTVISGGHRHTDSVWGNNNI